MNKQKFLMSTPTITRDHTPGSGRNSIKTMILAARWEMRPDSPAWRAEQFLFPHQTGKEPWFSWWNTRESPGTLWQNEMNADAPQEFKIARCTQNQLEMKPISPSFYPYIPFSTEYSTSGLTSLRKLQRFSETPASNLYEYSFQHSSSKKVPCSTYHLKMRADSLSLTEEVSQFSTST